MAKTIFVWQDSPNPVRPFLTKNQAAHTIQEALDDGTLQAGDVVVVHGKCQNGRCVYNENIQIPIGGITISGQDWPIIDGGNNSRVVTFKSNESKVTEISNFEIRAGKINGNGGGLYAKNAAVYITNNCIHDNHADGTGGGICLEYTSKTYYYNSEILSNRIFSNQSFHGGGIGAIGDTYPVNDPDTSRPVMIMHNVIEGNRAGHPSVDFVYGGGISIYRIRAYITINEISKNTVSHGNSEDSGAGLCVYNIDQNSFIESARGSKLLATFSWNQFNFNQVELRENHIHHNYSSWDGGGVSGLWGASISYRNNLIENNHAGDDGGGIYSTTSSFHVFYGNKITQNNALNGGGIHATCKSRIIFYGPNIVSKNEAHNANPRLDGNGGGISIRNSDLFVSSTLHVTENKSSGYGGGICAMSMNMIHFLECSSDCELSLMGCIVENNNSIQGGGGIAVIKDILRPPSSPKPVRIFSSIINQNYSNSANAGIYISDTSTVTSTSPYRIEGCLIENHNHTVLTNGICIRGHKNNSNFFSGNIVTNTIRNNGLGVYSEYADPTIMYNNFDSNLDSQLVSLISHPKISNNEFSGKNISKNGIIFAHLTSGSTIRYETKNNNIYGHTAQGFNSNVPVDARNNWWGKSSGPSYNNISNRGDHVSQNVIMIPFETTKHIFSILSIPNLKQPITQDPPKPAAPECIFHHDPPDDGSGMGSDDYEEF